MSNPGEPSPEQPAPEPAPMTPAELLAQLRLLQNQLFSTEVVDQVKQLPAQADKQDFVDARARLGTQITRLETAQLAEIRQQLEQASGALQQGIDDLGRSLARLENVNAWAGAINGVLGIVAQIVPLL
jgi:DNA-binding transcriptional MerR regulator